MGKISNIAEVKVLVEGYAKKSKNGWKASPATVLIRDGGKNVLVDPGANEKALLKSLTKENVSVADISLIFLTHYHPDHFLNIRLFPGKDILDEGTIFRGDEEIEFEDKIPGTNIKIIPTPGHAYEHVSLAVDTEKGKVVIAGDLFWWGEGEDQRTDSKSLLKKGDAFVKSKKDLLKSRKKILRIADYIIPGHGKMFKAER